MSQVIVLVGISLDERGDAEGDERPRHRDRNKQRGLHRGLLHEPPGFNKRFAERSNQNADRPRTRGLRAWHEVFVAWSHRARLHEVSCARHKNDEREREGGNSTDSAGARSRGNLMRAEWFHACSISVVRQVSGSRGS